MKTCSSLAKIISDEETNYMQNKWNKYRNVSSNHRNTKIDILFIYVACVDLTDMQTQD